MKKRATTFDEYMGLMGQLFGGAEKAAKSSEPLQVKETDVVISPFGKSGTTWLQQMFHQLRTGGDMDFDDISRVVPWIETSPMLGINLNADQRAEPRGFKSHLPYDQLPQPVKVINSVRHPADVAWSMFKFMEGWFVEPGAISPDDFVTQGFLAGHGYYDHLKSYWQVRYQPNVLFLSYEGMLADPEGTIRQVADFCEIPLNDPLMALVKERTSIDYMLAHKDRFDDALMRAFSERDLVPTGSDSAKVRSGKSGENASLSQAVRDQIDQQWQDIIGKELGISSYEDLIAQL